MSPFKKAERSRAKFKGAIVGPSGSGKTFSALLIASGLGKKIAVVDTEHGSASLYSDKFEFDTVELTAPYTPDRYIHCIKEAQRAGYDVLIIDSISHSWQGEGGVLEKKSSLDARGGSQFGNWRVPKQENLRLTETILQADLHIITTIRAKQGYAIVEDNGKQKVQKLGMDPIAEPGVEYSFSIVFDLAMDHNASASKDRSGIFDGKIFKPTVETGKEILAWLTAGKEQPLPVEQPIQISQRTLACTSCQKELVLHSSGKGYVCPDSQKRGDGHSRILKSEMEKQTA